MAHSPTPHTHADDHAHHPSVAVYLTVFALLMALLVATVVASEFEVGEAGAEAVHWNLIIAAGIASTKAILIMLFFMHVRYSPPLTWLVAGAGFYWLAILFGHTLADYFTRAFTPFSQQQ